MGEKASEKSKKERKQKEMRWKYEYAGPDEEALDAAFKILFDEAIKNWDIK
jgi:hypothetical protein